MNVLIKDETRQEPYNIDNPNRTFTAHSYRIFIDGEDIYKTDYFDHAILFVLEYWIKLKYKFPTMEEG